MKQLVLSILVLMTFFCSMNAQEEIKLYKNGPKESNGITDKESLLSNGFVINISEHGCIIMPPQKKKQQVQLF